MENKFVPFEIYATTLIKAQHTLDDLRPNARWRAVLLLDTVSGGSMIVAEFVKDSTEEDTKFQKAIISSATGELLMAQALDRTMTTQELEDLVDNEADKFTEEQHEYENK